MFLSSAFVPSAACPTGRTETFASHRNDPSSIFPSQMPRYFTVCQTKFRYFTASCAERMSGSLTISMSGMPERLKSIRL